MRRYSDAEFGVGNSTLIIDRYNGKPLVAVAAIFQHSPFVILARRDNTLVTVHDLEGRRLMVEEHAAELIAYLKLAGVDLDKIDMVPHSGNVRNLAMGDPLGIDATTAYTSTEPYDAIQANIPYRIFNPRDINIDFYGDTLFTSQRYLEQNPETVRAMRDAVIKGWEYARDHQDEIISLIVETYSPKIDRLQLSFEAQAVHDLLATDFVDIGYMSMSRWRHIADVFAQAGMLPADYPLDGFIYAVEDRINPQLLKWLVLVSAFAILASLIAHRFYRLNRELKDEIGQRISLQEELEKLAITDPLSGLANRRHLMDRARDEIERSVRLRHDLALIVIDLDNFKDINDRWGHLFGDRCIQEVAGACRTQLRAIDLAARPGGDEFAILLPETDQPAAQKVVQRLRHAISEIAIAPPGEAPVELSASFGLDFLKEGDHAFDDLIARADADMYRHKAGKAQGRRP